MATLEDTWEQVLLAAISRADEVMQTPGADPIGGYPMFWIYSAFTQKDWDQIRDEATDRFIRSRTLRELDRFEASLKQDDADAWYRQVLDYFSMALYCKWKKLGPVRRHKWLALELALTCPDDKEAFRRANFREQIEDEIAYLDFDSPTDTAL
jgi:hypothetical protein